VQGAPRLKRQLIDHRTVELHRFAANSDIDIADAHVPPVVSSV
jgi:hypothetical protein